MTVQYSTGLRNGILDAWETAMGTAMKVEIRTGAQPANAAAASTGTLLVSYTLASDWAANAAAGSKSFNNLPIAGTAGAAGTAGHYRFFDNAGTTCHEQGSITATGGGGDMTIDNTSIANGQAVNITGYTKNTANFAYWSGSAWVSRAMLYPEGDGCPPLSQC